MTSKPPIRTVFKDGRDASDGTPWEVGTANEPVFIDSFIEYEDVPYAFATDGSLFRMLPSSGSSLPYRLETADDDPAGSDILFKGSTIPENEAVALL